MKLMRVPADRSPLVPLTCQGCRGRIETHQAALADIDGTPVAYYHVVCVSVAPVAATPSLVLR